MTLPDRYRYANDNIVRYRPRRRGQWALVRATVLDWLASWMFGAAQLCRVAALTLSRWAMR